MSKATENSQSVNRLDALETTAGAATIGASAVNGLTGVTVQAQLNELAAYRDLYSKIQSLGNVSGATAVTVANGGYITATATAAATWTFSFTGLPTGYAVAWTLKLTNGGIDTQTFTDVKWSGGVAPTLSAAGTDRIVFTSDGVDIIGSLVNTAVA